MHFKNLNTYSRQPPSYERQKTGPTQEFVLSTDASQFGIGAVLLQKDENNDLRPVSYFSKSLNKAQRNYPVYDQELLAIVCAMKESDITWRDVNTSPSSRIMPLCGIFPLKTLWVDGTQCLCKHQVPIFPIAQFFIERERKMMPIH